MELPGIGGADGGDSIGAEHGPLHQIHAAVHLEGAVLVPAPVQAEEVLHRLRAELSLVLHIMNGKHRADAAQGVPAPRQVLPVDGDQGGLPVVAVDDIRHPIQQREKVHHRPGEKAEALAVVPLPVEAAPGKIVLVIHKIPGDALIVQRKQPAVFMPPGKVYIDVLAEGHLLPPPGRNGIIQRQDHRYPVAALCQGHRKASGYIRQAAGFAEGGGLPCYIENIHLIPPRPCPAPGDIFPYPPGVRRGRPSHLYRQ